MEIFSTNNEVDWEIIKLSRKIILFPKFNNDFEKLKIENELSKEKETTQYKKIMNSYMEYLYRKEDIKQICEQLRILFNIYNTLDKENTTVADYERLIESIKELTEELNDLVALQEVYENNKTYNKYVDYIMEEELKLSKLKK